jgi:hypothetical protein
MCAIEAGNVNAVARCLEQGLDVNEQWGATKDTPLMFAIKKLAAENENQENTNKNMLVAASSILALAGLGYGGWHLRENARDFTTAFHDDWMKTVRTRYVESVAYPAGGITAFAATLFVTSTLLDSVKRTTAYVYYRWKTSRARLSIIEKLINCPSIDLTVRNEIQTKEGRGQNALDVVQLLQKKDNSDYINDLLETVEDLIEDRMSASVHRNAHKEMVDENFSGHSRSRNYKEVG